MFLQKVISQNGTSEQSLIEAMILFFFFYKKIKQKPLHITKILLRNVGFEQLGYPLER